MKRALLPLVTVVLFALGGAWLTSAQEKPAAPPALTDVQKLQFQVLAQRIEIAQLRAQAAQTEFDKARDELQKLIVSLQRPGYDLDLQTLAYIKKLAETPPKE